MQNIVKFGFLVLQAIAVSDASHGIEGVHHCNAEVDLADDKIEEDVKSVLEKMYQEDPFIFENEDGKTYVLEDIELKRLAIAMTNKSFKATYVLAPSDTNSTFVEETLDVGAANSSSKSLEEKFTEIDDSQKKRVSVVIRVYGKGSEIFTDRRHELAMMKTFSDYGFGAKLLATYKNGLVVKFIEGRVLEPEELSQSAFYPKIAQQLAKIHQHKIEFTSTPDELYTMGVWNMLYRWLAVAKQFHEQKELFQSPSLPELESIIEEVKQSIKSHGPGELPSLSHNDINHGNIIYTPETDHLTFVDFEASHYGDRRFDLGNHFCEWAGLDLKFERFPDISHQLDFLRYYLAAEKDITLDKVDEVELQELQVEVHKYSLVSHLLWHIWAKIQSRVSDLSHYDYDAYAAKRMDEFNKKKYLLYQN